MLRYQPTPHVLVARPYAEMFAKITLIPTFCCAKNCEICIFFAKFLQCSHFCCMFAKITLIPTFCCMFAEITCIPSTPTYTTTPHGAPKSRFCPPSLAFAQKSRLFPPSFAKKRSRKLHLFLRNSVRISYDFCEVAKMAKSHENRETL